MLKAYVKHWYSAVRIYMASAALVVLYGGDANYNPSNYVISKLLMIY